MAGRGPALDDGRRSRAALGSGSCRRAGPADDRRSGPAWRARRGKAAGSGAGPAGPVRGRCPARRRRQTGDQARALCHGGGSGPPGPDPAPDRAGQLVGSGPTAAFRRARHVAGPHPRVPAQGGGAGRGLRRSCPVSRGAARPGRDRPRRPSPAGRRRLGLEGRGLCTGAGAGAGRLWRVSGIPLSPAHQRRFPGRDPEHRSGPAP